jgi:hypothetical protein
LTGRLKQSLLPALHPLNQKVGRHFFLWEKEYK